MKKGLCLFGKIFISVLVLFLCGMVLSAYITLEPPASVVTTLFRMAYQILLKYLVGLLAVILGVSLFVSFKKRRKMKIFSKVCLFLIGICFLGTVGQWLRLWTADSIQNAISYESVKAGQGREKQPMKEMRDLTKELGVEQCQIYMSSDNETSKTCIIYMNYGGWEVQDESMGAQILSFCEKEGYSFIRFAKARGEGKYIDSMAIEASEALEQLIKREQFEHVFLCGGSAGGHMALLCGFGTEQVTPSLPMKNLPIDGVICLYPCVDPEASYDYYVGTDTKKKTLLDHMGDKLFVSLYGVGEGTLASSTQAIDEKVFGHRQEFPSLYQLTAIKNIIGNKNLPVLMVQGEADTMMYVQSVRDFYDVLQKEGNKSVYLELPGTDHVFDLMPTAAWDRCEREMTGFVRHILAEK